MTLLQWLTLNPNHSVKLAGDPEGVRAVLSGGNGIDQRLVGVGADETLAIQRALEVRDAISNRLAG